MATLRSADEAQAAGPRPEERGAGLPGHRGGGAGGVLQRGDERAGVEREALALAEIAVPREGDERRARHEVLEGLLEQREGPALAQVAQDDGVRRAVRGRPEVPPTRSRPRHVLQRAGRDERRDAAEAAARISSTPASVAVTISSVTHRQAIPGEPLHQHAPRAAGRVGHELERGPLRSRIRPAPSAAPGMAASRGVEGAVEIEQEGGGGRWHGCRVRSVTGYRASSNHRGN